MGGEEWKVGSDVVTARVWTMSAISTMLAEAGQRTEFIVGLDMMGVRNCECLGGETEGWVRKYIMLMQWR